MIGLHRAARLIAWVLLTAGVLTLGYAGYVFADAKAFQAIEQRRFERTRHTVVPVAAAPPVEGDVVGEMQVPRLGLKAMVVHGESPAVLRRAVGHLPRTALPGQAGNVVLAGHRDTFFRPLKDVRVGDAISLKTLTGDYEYVVESTSIVQPDDIRVLRPTETRTLTLITCFPFFYLGPAPDRFIVVARETGASR